MSKSKKMTKKELSELNDLRQKTSDLKDSMLQIMLLKDNLETQWSEVRRKYSSVQEDYSNYLKALEEKYGNVNIDLRTGKITESDDNKGDT